jgi:hypothetical protein
LRAIAARAALVAAAAGAGVWIAGDLRAVREEAAATELVTSAGGGSAAARAQRAEELLRQAASRTPSTRPELRLAQLFVLGGEHERAIGELSRLVAAEPRNAEAWSLLARALDATEPSLAAAARRHAAAIAPPQD